VKPDDRVEKRVRKGQNLLRNSQETKTGRPSPVGEKKIPVQAATRKAEAPKTRKGFFGRCYRKTFEKEGGASRKKNGSRRPEVETNARKQESRQGQELR